MGQDRAQVDLLAVGPEVLERIELARLVVEDVHDHAAVVEQHPRAAAIALDVPVQMTKYSASVVILSMRMSLMSLPFLPSSALAAISASSLAGIMDVSFSYFIFSGLFVVLPA